MPKILICAATRTEAEGARRGIRQAGLEGRFETLTVGIGPDRAARALKSHLAGIEARERPERVISTGFAGSWSPDLRTGEWIDARSVRDETENVIELEASKPLARPALLCSVASIHASPPEERIQALARHSLPVAVDMESFSLARVARDYGIAVSVLRYVTDSRAAPLPDFVRHFTRMAAPPPGEKTAARAREFAQGARALLSHPSSVAALLRDGARWRAELIAGWARFAACL